MKENPISKWLSLFSLSIQNLVSVLLMRYVRTRPTDLFLISTAVLWTEVIKCFLSLCILLFTFKWNISKYFSHIKENIYDYKDWMSISVPAIIYVIQNNLVYVAVSHLDAVTFQVLYQLKLLTTALFFRVMLKKPQSKIQWLSLFILFCGIALIQKQQTNLKPSQNVQTRKQNAVLGLIVIIILSIMSGFGGVYLEKILKNTCKDLWIRNIQLSVYGIIFSFVTIFGIEENLKAKGMFYGYDWLVWATITIQSVGGLLVAVVMKYADNILKGFATTISIILAAIISFILFNFQPNLIFIGGTSLVIVSTICYSAFPYKPSLLLDPDIIKPTETGNELNI